MHTTRIFAVKNSSCKFRNAQLEFLRLKFELQILKRTQQEFLRLKFELKILKRTQLEFLRLKFELHI